MNKKNKTHYVAKVTPVKNGFLGEVVEEKSGRYGGFSSRASSADEAAKDAIHIADSLNEQNRKKNS